MEYTWKFMKHIVMREVFFGFLWKIARFSGGKIPQTLNTVDMYREKLVGDYEQGFEKLEIQVTNISCNMYILTVSLERKFAPSCDFGGSHLDIGLEWKEKYSSASSGKSYDARVVLCGDEIRTRLPSHPPLYAHLCGYRLYTQ